MLISATSDTWNGFEEFVRHGKETAQVIRIKFQVSCKKHPLYLMGPRIPLEKIN